MDCTDNSIEKYPGYLPIISNKGVLISLINHSVGEINIHEYYANAKLIASAPDLLEANQENLIDLKILKDNIESELRVNPEGRWQRMDDQVQKWIERTEKAIEKALS